MPTIHVDAETREVIRTLAAEMGIPMSQVLRQAARVYWEERFWKEFNEGYARLRADPVAWAEELEERRLWDNTLMDGLEDDPWPQEDIEAWLSETAQTGPVYGPRPASKTGAGRDTRSRA
jgi:hypothetical protein